MTVPDRLLIQAVRWIPALMLAAIAAIGAIAWAVIGGPSVGWLLAIALLSAEPPRPGETLVRVRFIRDAGSSE